MFGCVGGELKKVGNHRPVVFLFTEFIEVFDTKMYNLVLGI